MSSVNQLNAQAKLLEIWKALNVPKYPLSIQLQTDDHRGVSTRADCKGRPCEIGRTNLTQKTCISDAIKLWNLAPEIIKQSKNVAQAKTEIKKYAKTIPI